MDKKIFAKAIDALIQGLSLMKQAVLAETAEAAPAVTNEGNKEEAPAKRGRKPKSNGETTAKASPKETEAEDDLDGLDDFEDLEDGAEETPKEITAEELRAKLVEFAQANSKEAAYKVLGKYKAKKVNDLKPADYTKVYADLSA